VRGLTVVFLVTLIVNITGSAGAQEKRRLDWPRNEWTGGISVGPTTSTITGPFVAESDWRTGGMIGGWAEYRADDHWAIALEFNLVKKGALNFVTTGGDSTSDLEISYVELPFLLKLYLPLHNNWDIGISSGITLGLRAGCTAVFPDGTIGGCTQSIVNGTDWGIPFSGDVFYYLPNSKGTLGVTARYSLGLSNVFQVNEDAKNRSWQFMIRYGFKL